MGTKYGPGMGQDDADIISPDEAIDDGLVKGPNIGDVPLKDGIDVDGGEALLKMKDNITTDHIIPATADILKFRSNIEKLSEFTLSRVDDTFAQRALDADGGVLVAGENYGGAPRASMRPSVRCTSVSRRSSRRASPASHKANLFNFGIVPLAIDAETYEKIEQGDDLEIVDDVPAGVSSGQEEFTVSVNGEWEFTADLDASEREREILSAGGKLSWVKQQRRRRRLRRGAGRRLRRLPTPTARSESIFFVFQSSSATTPESPCSPTHARALREVDRAVPLRDDRGHREVAADVGHRPHPVQDRVDARDEPDDFERQPELRQHECQHDESGPRDARRPDARQHRDGDDGHLFGDGQLDADEGSQRSRATP